MLTPQVRFPLASPAPRDEPKRQTLPSVRAFQGRVRTKMSENTATNTTQLSGQTRELSLEGQVLSDKYRIERLLGAGGMGSVYVAEHALTRRKGALKLLHSSYSKLPEAVERFVREAAAAALIDNSHVVETYDAGTLDTGQPYIFMELLEGISLDRQLAECGACPLDEAVELAAQAAEGLGAAHRAGVVHRDVKPGNLFVANGKVPFVKVLDFGISKFEPEFGGFEQQLTQEGAVLGTPLYMSPEQVMGRRDVDARTDVYSLAVVLYEMLTGVVPFTGDTLMQLSVRICAGECVPLSQRGQGIPNELDLVVRRAMSAGKAQRYPTCAEFATELRRCQEALTGVGVPRWSTTRRLRPHSSSSAPSSAIDLAGEPTVVDPGASAPPLAGNAHTTSGDAIDVDTINPDAGVLAPKVQARAAEPSPALRSIRWARWALLPLLAGLAWGTWHLRHTLTAPEPTAAQPGSAQPTSEPARVIAAQPQATEEVAPQLHTGFREAQRASSPRTGAEPSPAQPPSVPAPRAARDAHHPLTKPESTASEPPAKQDGLIDNPFRSPD